MHGRPAAFLRLSGGRAVLIRLLPAAQECSLARAAGTSSPATKARPGKPLLASSTVTACRRRQAHRRRLPPLHRRRRCRPSRPAGASAAWPRRRSWRRTRRCTMACRMDPPALWCWSTAAARCPKAPPSLPAAAATCVISCTGAWDGGKVLQKWCMPCDRLGLHLHESYVSFPITTGIWSSACQRWRPWLMRHGSGWQPKHGEQRHAAAAAAAAATAMALQSQLRLPARQRCGRSRLVTGCVLKLR